jgi:hypothetical protein
MEDVAISIIDTWLKGNRGYAIGITLYAKYIGNATVLYQLRKGENDIRKNIIIQSLTNFITTNKSNLVQDYLPIAPVKLVNATLYDQCKKEADNAYKKLMNDRAILFKLATVEDFENPNLPVEVENRKSLALHVVSEYERVSSLYELAQFVKVNGVLPPNLQPVIVSKEIPDSKVKHELDNARKLLNKWRKREQSTEVVAKVQLLENQVKVLEQRWQTLN